MSFQFAPGSLLDATHVDWPITVAAWRGSCLEVFSRAERSVDDIISALEESGRDLGPDAHHVGAAARLRALKTYLETHELRGHEKACVRFLEQWTELCRHRAALAHGEMKAGPQGAKLTFRPHDGKRQLDPVSAHFDQIEMVVLLKQLADMQSRLHGQLGQIKAAIRRAA